MDNIPNSNLTTPKKLTISLRSFLKKISPNQHQRMLKFHFISDKYLAKHCQSNCESENILHGTPIVFGWSVWADSNYIYENKKYHIIDAEFHAVLNINNELVDITPRKDGEELIMFVPDPSRVAKRINSRTWETWRNITSVNGDIVQDTEISYLVE